MILNETIKRLGKVKTELVVLLILVPLVVVLGALLVRWPNEKAKDNTESTTEFEENIVEAPLRISAAPKTTGQLLVPEREAIKEVTLKTTENGHDRSWQVAIKEEISVAEVLNKAQANGYLDIKSTDYGGSMGIFIESLDGIANNNIEKVYWHLYINDVLSPVGASQAVVKAGDRVIWKYEKEYNEN